MIRVRPLFPDARCFRTDQRADRHLEFTRRLELAFATRGRLECLEAVTAAGRGRRLALPRRCAITYARAMERYGVDRPDPRSLSSSSSSRRIQGANSARSPGFDAAAS